MRKMCLNYANERIPHSPLESSNELKISKLDDFSLTTGTQPGQYESSLYSAIVELCKEKKCLISSQHLTSIIFRQNLLKGKSLTSIFLSRILALEG